MKKRNKIIIGILIAFILGNLAWVMIVNSKYNGYTKVVPKNNIGVNYIKDGDGFHYNVKKPDYLTFTGNLAVTDKEDKLTLIIWPQIFRKYKYGVIVNDRNLNHHVYVNEKLEPQGNYDDKIKKLIEINKEQLDILLDKANKMWTLY